MLNSQSLGKGNNLNVSKWIMKMHCEYTTWCIYTMWYIYTMWCIYSVEYCCRVKKTEIKKLVGKWMELEHIGWGTPGIENKITRSLSSEGPRSKTSDVSAYPEVTTETRTVNRGYFQKRSREEKYLGTGNLVMKWEKEGCQLGRGKEINTEGG